MSAVQNSWYHKLTYAAVREFASDTVKKVMDFIISNKSIIFFGLTILFSYFMMPSGAYDYLHYWSGSFMKLFSEGALFGISILMLKHLFTSNSLTSEQDDNINYLAGAVNVVQSILSPSMGLVNSVAMAGFIIVKTMFRSIFSEDGRPKQIMFLIEKS